MAATAVQHIEQVEPERSVSLPKNHRQTVHARGIDPAALGFDLSDDDSGAVWAPLEAEWRTAIKARFDTGVLSDDVAEVRPA